MDLVDKDSKPAVLNIVKVTVSRELMECMRMMSH